MLITADAISVNPTDHPVHPIIAGRWSPRAFRAEPIDPSLLRSVLEAARWAPSTSNLQPWHFIIATNEDQVEHARLVSTLMDGNIRWAKHAPVLMLVVVKQFANPDGTLSSRSLYEAGLAVGALTFEAGAHGLAVHQMAGFHADKVRATYDIPAGYEPAAALALGYAGDPAMLPDDLRERELAPRSRKALADFVFSHAWGTPADLMRP